MVLQHCAAAKPYVCYKHKLARAQLSGKISARASLLIMSDAATSALFPLVCVLTSLHKLFVSDSYCEFAPLHASIVPDSGRALRPRAWGSVLQQTDTKRSRMLSVYRIQTKVCLPLPRCVSHFTRRRYNTITLAILFCNQIC